MAFLYDFARALSNPADIHRLYNYWKSYKMHWFKASKIRAYQERKAREVSKPVEDMSQAEFEAALELEYEKWLLGDDSDDADLSGDDDEWNTSDENRKVRFSIHKLSWSLRGNA